MRKSWLAVGVLMVGLGRDAAAQAPTVPGSITGVVRDQQGDPIAGANVVAFPETVRAVTDSAGRFQLIKFGGGFYHVRVRRIGFTPAEITTDLAKNGHVELKFELRRRPVVLDSIVIQDKGVCPALSYVGFNCRKRFGKGVYLTDDDIADKGAVELGDVFSDVNGFRIEMVPSAWGQRPVPRALHGERCLNALVNGRPYALTNQLPRYATDLLAVEIYAAPADVPPEYERYVWMSSIRQTATAVGKDSPNARCSLVVYWTSFS
jgi:hypothetical protein